ncbi:hypothetical protein [Thermomonas sp. HDW16]|uniref:hypothetical protein n=1 Tax=Thermomonas sp. HDW16 TaxID=2714945 RepID=UPI0014083BC1|nr:hypothetical protein [Thermomonas sp. HDW16]QIL21081.1 hypothetical protein G7079_10275 [Thermomonas sp. HDW16]
MIKKFAAALALTAVISLLAMPQVRSGQYLEAWSQIAPNLAVEALGLLAAVLFAEHYLRRFRLSGGVEKIAPTLMRQMGPAVVADTTLIRAMEYTPREFKAILGEYIDGSYDPMHIPKDFVDRFEAALKLLPPDSLSSSAVSIRRASEFAGRFANLLDEEQLVLLESAESNWAHLEDLHSDSNSEPRRLAEAFLDAHDVLGDVAQAFGFPEAIKKIKAEQA